MNRLSASTENNSNNNRVKMSRCLKDGCHQVSMTNMELARAADASYALHHSEDSIDIDKPHKNPLGASGVRFNLRKRSVTSIDRPKGAMSSAYNSAFLSGLFADIANATNNEEQDPRLNEGASIKKSRTSMTRSFIRCHQSYHNLAEVISPPNSPGAAPSTDTVRAEDDDDQVEHTISRENSLSYQLHCVSSSSSDEDSVKATPTTDFCKLAFPNLPATVSDQDLTRMLHSRTASETSKETYGWFVEMDADDVDTNTNAYKSSDEDDLAFSAPTAPKTSTMDDQVEWAKAADTVDDVLGDFF